MTQWQPIETMPEGIDALVWDSEWERIYIGYQLWGIVESRDPNNTVLRPTHWMPLPEPPTA